MTVNAKRPPRVTLLIRSEIRSFMDKPDPNHPGQKVGDSKAAIYAFYDYDGEPIYVGQTSDTVRARVGRHLTGQRSDVVAKFILDPFEVADIEVWTIPEIAASDVDTPAKRRLLNEYEFTVYQKLKSESRFKAVLNEEVPKETLSVPLPLSIRGRIIPESIWEDRVHADVRIARRANIVGRLAQLISERQVKGGIRRTLHLQTQRLEWLSRRRLEDLGITSPDSHEDTLFNFDET
ncbi:MULTISPECIES: GIY-YIG nuclease family protein [unclassified Streptomyces]|uniref:GIY-YIG nuclease family protein n=1 Tax=unclassified Streptomyces TaxID=2593676 RepID=UPI0007C72397|nr:MULTISPECIES: GIY-YIG nuclease family protein [unclassified Streptomyces]THC52370.1 GIY-YIG nuclease family protein [Streptomyces sp. A1499]